MWSEYIRLNHQHVKVRSYYVRTGMTSSGHCYLMVPLGTISPVTSQHLGERHSYVLHRHVVGSNCLPNIWHLLWYSFISLIISWKSKAYQLIDHHCYSSGWRYSCDSTIKFPKSHFIWGRNNCEIVMKMIHFCKTISTSQLWIYNVYLHYCSPHDNQKPFDIGIIPHLLHIFDT